MKKYFIIILVLIAVMAFQGNTGRATAPNPLPIPPIIEQPVTIEYQIGELGNSLDELNRSYENR